jgi:hypothetical protein
MDVALREETKTLFFLLPRLHRNIQLHSRLYQRLKRGLVQFIAFVQINGAAHIAFQAGIEKLLWIVNGRTPRESEFDCRFIGFTCADDAVKLPHWHAAPFPFFDHIGFGFVDEFAHLGQHGAAPIGQFSDALGDVFRRTQQ